MAHTYNKIESADLANKGNVGMPDTPNLTTEEMQQKLDELPNLIIEKFNTLIDELNEYVGSAIVSSQFNALRFDENNNLQFSTDGGTTWQSSSSIIQVNVSPEDIHMDNYTIGSSASNIERSDTLNQAIGKIEGRTDNLGDSLPNLIPYPYNNETRSLNGLTFTVNEDASVTVTGTATADTYFACVASSEEFKLPVGNYHVSGCPSGGSSSTYYFEFAHVDSNVNASYGRDYGNGNVDKITGEWPDSNLSIGIMIKSGYAINGSLVFKPMVVTGTNKPTKFRKYINPEVFMSQAEYDALPTKDKRTVYNTY